jgi:hypothetical protein
MHLRLPREGWAIGFVFLNPNGTGKAQWFEEFFEYPLAIHLALATVCHPAEPQIATACAEYQQWTRKL